MIRRGVKRFFHLALRRRDRWEREVEDEIKLHLALRAEQLAAEGRPLDEAHQEALRRFGPLTESRARLVDAARHREVRMQRTEFFADLKQDVRFAMRTLRRQKAWTSITILTLALGIGATTAVFSVVSALLLHATSFPHPDRIVYVWEQGSRGGGSGTTSVSISPSSKEIRAWMRDAHDFELIEPFRSGPMPMRTTGNEPRMVMVESVAPTYTDLAGVTPMLGRMFTSGDIAAGTPTLVLTEQFWRETLASRTDVIGQRLTLRDTSYTIVGVLPAAAQRRSVGAPIAMWIPADVEHDPRGFAVMARLRPGVTPAAAARELNVILARERNVAVERLPFTAAVATPGERVAFRDSLMLLTAAVVLVLLVACANVAHLLLARASTRRREMAIRAALGAGRGRLLRQLLAESVLLSVVGAASGIFVGWIGLRTMIALRPDPLASLKFAHLDPTTLLLVAGVAVVCAIAFALLGAGQSARSSTHDTLKQTPSGGSGGRARGRGLLVVSEMALSALLLVGATLLIRSVINLQRTDLGFDTKGLYQAYLPLSGKTLESSAARVSAVSQIVARLRQNPAITGVAVADVGPGSSWLTVGRLEIDGESSLDKTQTSMTDVNAVDHDYFALMGIRLREGRTFSDTTESAQQVIVNESFAGRHWKGSALGHRLRIVQSNDTPWMTIVGVVRDVQTGGPLSESSGLMLYTPRTADMDRATVLVRTTGDASAAAQVMNDVMKQFGEKSPLDVESVDARMATSIATPKFVMLLLTIFTALALLLAAIGLYGVMAYAVVERTREIGIRVALGASDSAIARGVVGSGAMLAVVGAAIGLGAAAWGTKLIEAQLFGVTRLDPASYGIGGVVLIGAALVASIVPTRRALAVDPMTAIRAE